MNKKILWECPTCANYFFDEDRPNLVEHLKRFIGKINNEMRKYQYYDEEYDGPYDEYWGKYKKLDLERDLAIEILDHVAFVKFKKNKNFKKNLSKMMEAQNICAEKELDGNSSIKTKEELIEQFRKDWAPPTENHKVITDEDMYKYLNIYIENSQGCDKDEDRL